MSRQPSWHKGAPDRIRTGMVVQLDDGRVFAFGSVGVDFRVKGVVRWCRLFDEAYLEWLACLG